MAMAGCTTAGNDFDHERIVRRYPSTITAGDICRLYAGERVIVRSIDERAVPTFRGEGSVVYEVGPGLHRIVVARNGHQKAPKDERTFIHRFTAGDDCMFITRELRGGGFNEWDVALVDYYSGELKAVPISSDRPGARAATRDMDKGGHF